MADVKEMQKVILDYVRQEYMDDEDAEKGQLDSPLISAGIVDSFSMVSLKRFLEMKYDIEIPDAQATPAAFDTVASIAALVERPVY